MRNVTMNKRGIAENWATNIALGEVKLTDGILSAITEATQSQQKVIHDLEAAIKRHVATIEVKQQEIYNLEERLIVIKENLKVARVEQENRPSAESESEG